MTIKVTAVLALLMAAQSVSAQTTKPTRNSGLGISYLRYDYSSATAIRSTSFSAAVRNRQFLAVDRGYAGLGLTYFKGAGPYVDFAATLNGSSLRLPLPNRNFADKSLLLEADASLNFKMFPDNYFFSPYLIAGIGASKYRNIYGAVLPLGGGLRFRISNGTALFATFQYRIPVTPESNNYHFVSSLGLQGLFGKKATPPPPPPPPVADSDNDGILDTADACPTVYGLAKYRGCPVPDTDKDGINDEEDRCPQQPGVAKYNGCPVPDSDKDGINDEDDRCPQQAGVARYQGCPVPDTDGDGINDEEDRCPNVAGVAANNGCPEVSKEVIQKVNYAAKRIYFVTGNAKLSSKSNAALNQVVKLLADDPNLKLSIEGHTDNVGKADFNKQLSDGRANSVRTYLVNKGVDESRLVAEGFGLERPIANNKTAAGRQQNRRVEMKLSY